MGAVRNITENDRCVQCRRLTPYHAETPVDMRKSYVPGQGQFCKRCLRIMDFELGADDVFHATLALMQARTLQTPRS